MSERMVYRIRDWRTRYEVNAKGGEAGDGDTLRLRPLDFVRWQVRGRDLGIGMRRLNKLAGEEFAPAAFGVFAKLVEIAAQESRDLRGYVLTSDGDPMTTSDIAEATEWSEVVIEKALTILSSSRIQWLEHVEFPEFPEIRAPYITKPNRREENITKPNRTAPARKPSVSASADASSDSVSGEEGAKADGGTPTETHHAQPLLGQGATNARPEVPLDHPNAPGAFEAASANNLNIAIPQAAPDQQEAESRKRALNAMFRRIRKITKDTEPWMDWWKMALPAIFDSVAVWTTLTELLDYAEKADGSRPDLGKLDKPGAYVIKRLMEATRQAGVKMPDTPTTQRKVAA